jgi:hypothetical protein
MAIKKPHTSREMSGLKINVKINEADINSSFHFPPLVSSRSGSKGLEQSSISANGTPSVIRYILSSKYN